jgi:hypothetical protein
MIARIAWISIAPVKGLALAQREDVFLGHFGVTEDRRFHLIGEDGRLLNGKQIGELVQVTADWDEDARMLELGFPHGARVAGEIELGAPVSTIFYGRPVEGRIVEGPWAEALSNFVGQPLRLVQPSEPSRALDRSHAAVSLLSTGSLDALSAAAGTSEPLDPRRFRMLLGIEGVAPHEEDTWLGRQVRIGEATLLVRGNVGRCLVTSRDPDTGVRNVPTLDALAEYRDGVETTEPLPFGVWGEVAEPGQVRLGNPVVAG